MAVSLSQRLQGRAVQRFRLEGPLMAALRLRMTPRALLGLLAELDALVEGQEEAGELIAEAERKKK